MYGHLEVAQILHERKGGINSQDRDNFTPLMYAVWKGHEEVVKYLLNNKAKLHLEGKYGWEYPNLQIGLQNLLNVFTT